MSDLGILISAIALLLVFITGLLTGQELGKVSKEAEYNGSDSLEDEEIEKSVQAFRARQKYLTPELIEWIATESDPIKLACTASLINTYKWPGWLPSKPIDYDENNKSGLLLKFVCDLMRTLEAKSNTIAPNLHKYIWTTNFYDKYKPK